MAAQSTLRIVLQFLKEGGADKETVNSLENMWKGTQKVAAVFGTLTAAGIAVDQIIQQTVGTFVNYADQVRNVQFITGATAEESSRLIQVADDMKVSYDELARAMQIASKQGITPNIDGLAQLSDKYLSLAAGTERETFLLKEFGKNGTAMAEMMSKGGAAIHEMAAAMEPGLILTQQNVDAARQYEVELDTLKDSVDAVKTQIGSKLVPVLNTALTSYLNFGEAMDQVSEATGKTDQRTKIYLATLQLQAKALQDASGGTVMLSEASRDATQTIQSSADAATKQATATSAVKTAVEELINAIAGGTGSSKQYFDMLVQDGVPASEAGTQALAMQASALRNSGLASLAAASQISGDMHRISQAEQDPISSSTSLYEKLFNIHNLSGQNWVYRFTFLTIGSLPNLSGMLKTASGAYTGRTIYTPQASGGPLTDIALVGDNPDGTPNATSELVINGTVIPASLTQILLRSGAISPRSMALGGDFAYVAAWKNSHQLGSITRNINRGGGVAGAAARIGHGGGGASVSASSGGGGNSAPVTQDEIAPIAEGAQAAAQATQAVAAAAQVQTAQSVAQTTAINEGNQAIVDSINALRQQFPRDVANAVKMIVGG